MIGDNGLHAGVVAELDLALDHHELIKLRISGADRDEKRQLAEAAAKQAEASLVQIIGNVAVLYRPAETPAIKLP